MLKDDHYNILIFDDNMFELQDFIIDLRSKNMCVDTVKTVDGFYDKITCGSLYDFIFIDIMMDIHVEPLCMYSTKGGCNSGIIIAKCLRSNGLNVPIIFISTDWLMPSGMSYAGDINSICNCCLIRKRDLKSINFLKMFDSYMETKKFLNNNSVIEILISSIILKPSIYGMGFDVKNIIEQWRK